MIIVRPMGVFTAAIPVRPLHIATAASLGNDAAIPSNHFYATISAQAMMHVHSTTGHMHVRRPSIGTLRDGIAPCGVSHCVTLRDRPGSSRIGSRCPTRCTPRRACSCARTPRGTCGCTCSPGCAWGCTRSSGCTRGCASAVRRSSGWTLGSAGRSWTFGCAGSGWTLRRAAGARTLRGGRGALRRSRMGSSGLSWRGLLVVGLCDVRPQE